MRVNTSPDLVDGDNASQPLPNVFDMKGIHAEQGWFNKAPNTQMDCLIVVTPIGWDGGGFADTF